MLYELNFFLNLPSDMCFRNKEFKMRASHSELHFGWRYNKFCDVSVRNTATLIIYRSGDRPPTDTIDSWITIQKYLKIITATKIAVNVLSVGSAWRKGRNRNNKFSESRSQPVESRCANVVWLFRAFPRSYSVSVLN